MDITQAIYHTLSSDVALTALLASYGGGSPEAPAIFTAWPVPSDATTPYLVSVGNVSVTPFDELSSDLGMEILRDVYVYCENNGSDSTVESISRLVRASLHRQSLTIPNGSHIMTQCVGGPIPSQTDETLVGRVLTFRIVAMVA